MKYCCKKETIIDPEKYGFKIERLENQHNHGMHQDVITTYLLGAATAPWLLWMLPAA